MSDPGGIRSRDSWLTRLRHRSESGGPPPEIRLDDDARSLATGKEGVANPDALLPYIVALDDPHSAAAEQFRLFAARLEGLWRQPEFQKVAVTSALAGEGKTLTTVNVACVLAKDFGRRVLVIDGDFRKPSLWRYMGSSPATGLTDLVANRQEPETVIRPLRYQHLGVMQVGLTTLNPTRLWKSQAMKRLLTHLGQQYDYVLVDTPPVLTVVDTALIADLVDGIVVVVRSGLTPRTALQKTLDSLPRAKVVGTVFNGARALTSSYYSYVR